MLFIMHSLGITDDMCRRLPAMAAKLSIGLKCQ